MNAQHLSIDELANAAEGLLNPGRAAFAESHLAGCAHCHAQSDALREVTATLRADPAPVMPDSVVHRMNEVLTVESARRVTKSDTARENEVSAARRRSGACARKVTNGRITGLASGMVDGTPALLVYTKAEPSTQVTVVTGCRVGMPSAGPSAVLPG